MRLVLLLLALSPPAHAQVERATSMWDTLVDRYVVDERWVDYAAWHASESDLRALRETVDAFEAVDPSTLERDARVAYWIDLYNAATLELVFDHYPVDSIKDIGGLLDSPWSREVVTVAGEDLTLDEIQKEKLAPVANDPRMHFAINCASVGCPPLASRAYGARDLEAALDTATRRTVHDSTWVDLGGCDGAYAEGEIRLSKIFDWYQDDFGGQEGVRAFLSRYRPEDALRLRNTRCGLASMEYDWGLNAPPAQR